MSIDLRCNCGRLNSVPGRRAGGTVRCAACGAELRIPEPSVAISPTPTAETTSMSSVNRSGGVDQRLTGTTGTDTSALASGSRLGKYEIVRHLGKGGMGTVYVARDPALNREVAIKLMNPRLAGVHNAILRFQAEAQAIARLSNPHIVHIYEFCSAKPAPYIVMEYVRGKTLSGIIDEEGGLPIGGVVDCARQALDGLGAAHRAGIVHRDVKPSNILRNEDGVYKLMDFGLARSLDTDKGLTTEGTVVGTLHYLAPEVARGDPATVQSDLYSIGVTLYEMLTGQQPFDDASPLKLINRIANQTPPPVTAHRTDVPPGLACWLGRLMAREPQERYQDAAQASRELALAVAGAVPAEPQQAEGPGLSASASSVQAVMARALELEREKRNRLGEASLLGIAADLGVSSGAVRAAVGERAARAGSPAGRKILMAALAGAGLLVLVGAVAVWLTRPQPKQETPPKNAVSEPESVKHPISTAPNIDDGLALYYSFDEKTVEQVAGGWRVIDLSGSHTSGTLKGAPQWVGGIHGRALSLDGRADRVAIPASLFAGKKALSVATWFKTSDSGVILGLQDEYYSTKPAGYEAVLYVGTDGRLRGQFWIDGVGVRPISTKWTVNDGTWHHVALVGNHDWQGLYLDGDFVDSWLARIAPRADTKEMTIGVGYTAGSWPAGNGGWYHFRGSLDDFRIYQRALSKEEVRRLAERPDSDSGPKGPPRDAKAFGGHSYKFFQLIGTWQDAKRRCEDMGGYLVCIGSREENEFVAELSQGRIVWIGASLSQAKSGWGWVDGSAFGYANWDAGQPDNKGGDQGYVALNAEKYGCWSDFEPMSRRVLGFVCEWDSTGAAGAK